MMPIYKMDGKRDGKTKYRVRVNYTDRTGAHRQVEKTTYGSEEAKLLEREMLYRYKAEPQSASMTVKRLFEQYMLVRAHEVRESTHDKTRRVMNYYILPALGNVKLDKLDSATIQKWKLSMEEAKTSSGKALSVSQAPIIRTRPWHMSFAGCLCLPPSKAPALRRRHPRQTTKYTHQGS